MSEAKFTEGPWKCIECEFGDYETGNVAFVVSSEAEIMVGSVSNCSLIAAAPDMFGYIAEMPCPNSCTPCRGKPYNPDEVYEGCPFCVKRAAVLNKARGEQ